MYLHREKHTTHTHDNNKQQKAMNMHSSKEEVWQAWKEERKGGWHNYILIKDKNE